MDHERIMEDIIARFISRNKDNIIATSQNQDGLIRYTPASDINGDDENGRTVLPRWRLLSKLTRYLRAEMKN